MIDLSIVIVNYNTKDLLRNCLFSIFQKTKGINYEVIIVDNGSVDGSVQMISDLKKGKDKVFNSLTRSGRIVELISNKENFGFARANNQGIKKARGEYILLLNSDTKLINNALAKLVNFAKRKKGLAVVGSKLINPGDGVQLSMGRFYTLPVVAISLLGGDRWLRRAPRKACLADWVEGSCFLIRRKVIDKVGLLDEHFFMYVEEMEFCYRIKKAGWQVWYYPKARVYHLVRGSSPEGRQRAIGWIYQGLIYFYQKHFAHWQLSVLKFLLRTKAAGSWLIGFLTGNTYLKQTYAQAFKLVG